MDKYIPKEKVEITHAMKEAGGSLIREYFEVVDSEYLAERVYIAMASLAEMPNSGACEPLVVLSSSQSILEVSSVIPLSSQTTIESYWRHRSVLCIEDRRIVPSHQPRSPSSPQDWIVFPVPPYLRRLNQL